ncbi:NAD(P)/FAD-dependent oxidoreductase [Lacimicrobium alkaliphilum]|uniref:Gamma-glutamylputrescine oxidoreductase n=1 Tax=Lacimicrobium alkaliphilum TaxID=1526571 RepID=A0ABQ1R9I7_9ALTE|nr:FAD-binding oxidoreductase [Lacimicrobium alkaliphilum]GGD63091.1 gamma-glutamylputrescine oxidoreductase [Lacimicrobium alkaliphilum]
MSDYINSYYAYNADTATPYPTLNEDLQADVCIMGGGFTGLSSALHLAKAGYKVVLLEANRIGFGATGRNGGQIVNSYSRDVDTIARKYGPDMGKAMGAMMFEGGDIIRSLIREHQIDCDHVDGGAFVALNHKQLKGLEEHQKLWQQYGNNSMELLNKSSLSKIVKSDRYTGGLTDGKSGHIQPLKLALGEARAIKALGGALFEQSPITKVEKGDRVRVHTAKGTVSADFLVVGANAYLSHVLPELMKRSMPCGTQIITTEILGEDTCRELLPANYCVEDCNYLLDYYRTTADHRLLYGGGVVYDGRDPDDIERLIRPKMEKTFPQLKGVKVDFAWTGNFLLTMSRLPEFGRLDSNIYYMQGYSGHGVTSTHLAGKVVSEAIKGQAERFDVFSKLPHLPMLGGRALQIPFTALGASYYNLRDMLGI